MKMSYLVLIGFIVGCGVDDDREEQLPPAPEEELNLYPEYNPDNIIMGYGMPQENASGECIKTKSQNFVIINQKYWDKLDEMRKRALILHELGHCVYNLQHDSSTTKGIPNSIMWPSVWNQYQIEAFEENEAIYASALSKERE